MRKTFLKIILISLIMSLAFSGYATAENATPPTGTCNITLTTNQETYNKGDEIEILVSVSNITTTGNGVDGFQGYLHFNNAAFEFVDYEGYSARYAPDLDWVCDGGEWMDADEKTNEGDAGICLMAYRINGTDESKNGPTTEDGNIMKIYMRVKDTAPDGNYEISLQDVELDGENETTHIITDYLVVSKAKKDVKIGNGGTTPTNNTVNNTTTNNTVVNNTVTNNTVANNTVTNNTVVNNTVVNNTVRNNTVNNTNVNNNVLNTILPYVGMNTPMFGIGIVVMLIAAGTALYKYRKYKSLK